MKTCDTHFEVAGTKAPLPATVFCPADDASSSSVGVILAHGAGGDHESGNMPAYARAFAAAGIPCICFTCKPPNLATRTAAFQRVLREAASGRVSGTSAVRRWVLAGHSMGGRVASSVAAAAAAGREPGIDVCGCAFLSYPLHPPGRTEELRDTPLCELKVGSGHPSTT